MGCGGSKAATADAPSDNTRNQTAKTTPAAAVGKSSTAASSAGVEAVDIAATTTNEAALEAPAQTKILVLYYSTYGHIRQVRFLSS